MRVTIKYFGLIADITRVKEEVYSSDAELLNVEDLINNLSHKYSGLSKASYIIAVNKSIATTNLKLNDNDVLALLPPFAGG